MKPLKEKEELSYLGTTVYLAFIGRKSPQMPSEISDTFRGFADNYDILRNLSAEGIIIRSYQAFQRINFQLKIFVVRREWKLCFT